MSPVRFDIISIGTLSRNRLWGETEPVRTPHATTTLIRAGKRLILVDPGLPPPALGARLFERTGLRPEAINTVFLTNFRAAHRAGLALFPKARTLMHELELDAARRHLEQLLSEAPPEDLDRSTRLSSPKSWLTSELRLLDTITPAADELAEQVDLFPLFGYTPGTSGLLISLPTATALIAGDAVPTQDHFLAGQVLPDTFDIKAAQESLQEIYEIADIIVPGHDCLFLNPRSYGA